MSDYRRSALRCPVCNALFEEQPRGDVRVEICNGCSGLFIDWLDGDVRAVVKEVADLPAPVGEAGRGTGACPHCAVELHPEAFGTGAVAVLRCGSCAGVFVPRSSFEELRAQASQERREEVPRDPFLTRLLDALERIVTPGR